MSDPKPLSPESIVYGRVAASQPALSPDGQRVAYVVTTPDSDTGKSTSHLWLTGIDGGKSRQLTQTGKKNLGPAWAPDGSSLAYVSIREGEQPNCLAVIPIDGGEARVVAQFKGMPADLAWDSKGGRIAFTMVPEPEDPEAEKVAAERAPKVRVFSSIHYKADGRGYLIDQTRQVHVIDVESGDVKQLTSGMEEHVNPAWSPDDATIATASPLGVGVFRKLVLISVETGERVPIEMPDWMLGPFVWSGDGQSILYFGEEGWGVQLGLHRLDIASRTIEAVASEIPFYVDVFASTFGLIDDSTVLTSGFHQGNGGLWTINTVSGEARELIGGAGFRAGFSTDDNASAVVQVSGSRDSWGELSVWDRGADSFRLITDLNASFRSDNLHSRVERASVERGGEIIEYWVTYPPDFDSKKSYPVILHIHGGPHGFFWDGEETIAAVLAASGRIVISPNPRGSGSYGVDFARKVVNDWGGEDWLDDLATLDTVLAQPYADASRTGIIGYSYGGYMTSWAIGQTDRFRAAVCGAPVFDLVSFRGTSDIGPDFFTMQWEGDWPDNKQWLEAHSPSTFIHRAVTPTLVVVGEDDHRCPVGQAEELFSSLIENGVPTEFVRYPGMSHGTLGGEPLDHSVDFYTRVTAWFDRFL